MGTGGPVRSARFPSNSRCHGCNVSSSNRWKRCPRGLRQQISAHQTDRSNSGQHDTARLAAAGRVQRAGDQQRHAATSNTGKIQRRRRSAVKVAGGEQLGDKCRN
jgi:hypothetical protein